MEKEETFYIVGIGASAGGLEAVERFFQSMPNDPGMAFVIIQHLSPDYKSMMAEILSKYTKMPVREANHDMLVEPDHVYLIPRKKTMTIKDGKLLLTEKEFHRGLSLPIDTFFQSLAADKKEYSIAIVLSGTGSDGTRGIRAIKEQEGMVVVQQLSSAKFDGMPSSAINTGLADFILSPEEMAKALLDYSRHPHLLENLTAVDLPEQQNVQAGNEVTRILDVIQSRSGVNFHQYKQNTVMRRIERRAGIRQVNNIVEYLQLLEGSEIEQDTLYRELLIGVTRFFRNHEVFKTIYRQVIPQLFNEPGGQEALRIWIAGCSTGEEVYSIAILLAEYKEYSKQSRDVKIFATDIDQNAIDIASIGSYPESIAADIEPERLSHYFNYNEREGRYTINQTIRNMVVFARHDLTKSPPFNRLDFISCRNLFIYLKSEMQEQILNLFHFALKPTGYLLLGESETIGEYDKVFTCLDKRQKIYQVRPGIPPKMQMTRDVRFLAKDEEQSTLQMKISTGRRYSRQNEDYLQRLVVDKLLPPCILITDDLDILYISQKASKYLTISGIPDYNLTRLLSDSMTAFVRSAVVNALKNNRAIVYKTLNHPTIENSKIEICVEPLGKKYGGALLLLMTISETEVSEPSQEKNIATLNISEANQQHIEELERELAYTRETLQATIEELETSNEELQSTNEELLASNEELQSTNEELQAVNEELITVNSEHQHKIQEITRLNETHTNLLHSSRVGSVFLDIDFNIRDFTPAIRDEIHLRDNDKGRPFEEIRHHLQIDNIHSHLQKVITEMKLNDIEVQSENGKTYILRITPFLLSDNRVDGVVLTLINITDRKKMEKELIDARKQAEAANYAKSVFLTNMSHELRTPLNAIHGFTQLLQKSPQMPNSLQSHVETIRNNGEHLLTLINDILDLSKVEAGQIELYPQDMMVKHFFQELMEMFSYMAKQKNVEFKFILSDSLPDVLLVDIKRLRQIIMNLLSNAIKFTEKGSVTLSVDYKEELLIIKVADTGLGISAEKKLEIFKPFFQTGENRYKSQGTGLGLAITEKIIVLMKGEISLESEIGQGCCFTVKLPLSINPNSIEQEEEFSDIGNDSSDIIFGEEWLDALENAINFGERGKIKELFMQYSKNEIELPRHLKVWIDGYNYQNILKWIHTERIKNAGEKNA